MIRMIRRSLEKETRKRKIDKMLNNSGWKVIEKEKPIRVICQGSAPCLAKNSPKGLSSSDTGLLNFEKTIMKPPSVAVSFFIGIGSESI